MVFKFCTALTILACLWLVALTTDSAAQVDPYGTVDLVYADSVAVSPGGDVAITFSIRNDEVLGSFSVPIVYDTNLLTLTNITFEGSRIEYLGTKITKPALIEETHGHFVVAAIQMQESPIPVGDGPVFTLQFHLSDSAEIGTLTMIDSLFYPPANELLLIGPNISGSGSWLIEPEYRAGKVLVKDFNRAPGFTALEDQYIMEGDTLKLDIGVDDPDVDKITLAVTSKPAGAKFEDFGDGTGRLTWSPAFVGPQSADGSPFVVRVWASDGALSAEKQIQVNVVNANRAPKITGGAEVSVMAGEELQYSLSALDPDFENITWQIDGLPSGAVFTYDNPAHLSWPTEITDSGVTSMMLIAADPHGLADTLNLTATITPVSLYKLSIDTVKVVPGEYLNLGVNLKNELPVTSFNLLFHYDPSALTLLSVTKEDTRIEGFEYFSSTPNADGTAGHLRVIALADIGGGATALPAGDGEIVRVRMRASSDYNYAGMRLPVRFMFEDEPDYDDNTLGDTIGAKIPQEDILYNDGFIDLQDIGQIEIGDINLNGLAYEIGDAIYFTNFFIYPSLYTFNILQYANSDINGDDIGATISDLVALINHVVNGFHSAKSSGVEWTADVTGEQTGDDLAIACQSACELGGALIELQTANVIDSSDVETDFSGMDMIFRQFDDRVVILLYSLEGHRIPSGATTLCRINGITDWKFSRVQLGSSDGDLVTVALHGQGNALPNTFALEQNYPNPFNPETQIEFSLPQSGRVELTIYNVLGRRVKDLVSGEKPAGTHTVVWDGTDADGRSVASGVYFYRLQAGSETLSRKMMLLK